MANDRGLINLLALLHRRRTLSAGVIHQTDKSSDKNVVHAALGPALAG